MATLQVNIGLLDEATNQVDGASFSGYTAGVERHFMLHLDRLLLKLTRFDSIDLRTTLVPLE